jgi:hypothetical protein
MTPPTFVDYAILLDPTMQATLAKHRAERKPCIFCAAPYHTTLIYCDCDAVIRGRMFIVAYDACESCLARGDFATLVDAEYRRDFAEAQTQLERMARRAHAWLN